MNLSFDLRVIQTRKLKVQKRLVTSGPEMISLTGGVTKITTCKITIIKINQVMA